MRIKAIDASSIKFKALSTDYPASFPQSLRIVIGYVNAGTILHFDSKLND